MYYINSIPTENGNYGNPQSLYAEGFLPLPDELLPEYLAAKGFVFLTVIEDAITAVSINQEAYDVYMEEHPDPPEPPEPEYSTNELMDILLGVSEDA